jgi:Golgi phosphoprotein 3
MSTITRRRVGGGNNSDEENNSEPIPSNDKRVAHDPRDVDERKSTPKLTIMEEVLLLGLKDKQARKISLYMRVIYLLFFL